MHSSYGITVGASANNPAQPSGPAKAMYAQMDQGRIPYLTRARECSRLTLPHLVPPDGFSGSTILPTPWQSVGATGVNNLAAKLLLLLLPPNVPFFRLVMTDEVLEDLAGNKEARAEVEEGLQRIERRIVQHFETNAVRATVFEALKHLIVSGNALLHVHKSGAMKSFRLDQYMVKRDPAGNVLQIVICEKMSRLELNTAERSLLGDTGAVNEVEDTVEVYTLIKKMENKWRVHREIMGKFVQGSLATYPLDKLPYIALRWNYGPGEDYGRGYVEQMIGDLKSLEALQKASVQAAAVMAKIIFLVNPNGSVSVEEISTKESGEFTAGLEGEVTVLQANKYADMSFVREMSATLERRIGQAFLLGSSIQRDAERVTAEEFRFMAQELEVVLGGTYTSLGPEFQAPLVRITMAHLEAANALPKLPPKAIRTTITTGFEALGRGNDLGRLKGFLADATAVADALDRLEPYLHPDDLFLRLATGHGVDSAGLVRTPMEQAEYQSMKEEQETMMAAVPNMVRAEAQAEQGAPA